MVEPGSGGSERLLTLRLNSTTGPVTLISVYAPTLSTTPDTEDMFYENLASIIRNITSKEQVVVLSDFNARVGAGHDSWPSCLGQFGVGKMNENGQRLLELCTFHDLCITNSFFRTKSRHKVSWRHPRSKHWRMASTGSYPGQACCYPECSPHMLLPQCGLRCRPLLGVL